MYVLKCVQQIMITSFIACYS